MGIPISAGTINHFNKDAFERLESFETWVKSKLSASPLIHSDETGINIGGDRRWLHNVSNDSFTYLYPHLKRGCEAMDEMGYCRHTRASSATITGNLISSTAACMLCAMPIICGNLREPWSRTNKVGREYDHASEGNQQCYP